MPKKLIIDCKTHETSYVEMTQEDLDQQAFDQATATAMKVEEDRKEKLRKRELIVDLRSKKTDAQALGLDYEELVADLQARIDALEAELNG